MIFFLFHSKLSYSNLGIQECLLNNCGGDFIASLKHYTDRILFLIEYNTQVENSKDEFLKILDSHITLC